MSIEQGERWAIFYTDGTVVTSADRSPWDVPRLHVQRIANSRDEIEQDWYNVQSYDRFYYEADRGGWNEARDDTAVMLHLLRARHPLIVFGEMLADRQWRSYHRRMNEWCARHRLWLIGASDDRPQETTYL